MTKYNIIRRYSVEEYAVEPLGKINPQFLRIPGITYNYFSESFGRNKNDIVLPIKHAIGLLRNAMKDDELIQLSSVQRQQLANDLKNYLNCLLIYPMTTGYTKMFIETLFSVGIFSEVFDCIFDYYSNLYYKGDRSVNDVALLNFGELYLRVADYLLFRTSDFFVAQKAYSLLGIDWRDVIERQKIYDDLFSQTWHRKASIYSDILSGEKILKSENNDNNEIKEIISLYNNLLENKTITNYSALIDICDSIVEKVNKSKEIDCKRLGFFVIESIRRHFCIKILYQFQVDYEKKPPKTILPDDIIWFARYLPKSISDYVSNMDDTKLDGQILCFVSIIHSMDIIRNQLRVGDDFDGTAYYTSFNTFSFMLPYKCSDNRLSECGKLAVMHVSYMNDPTEGQILKEIVFKKKGNKDDENERINANVPYVFIKCFTGLPDYLPMWNMYGDSAKGVSLVMDWDSKSKKLLYRVCYVDSKKRINKTDNPGINVDVIKHQISFIRRQIRKNNSSPFMDLVNNILEPVCFLFKSSSYGYEKEMRMLYQFDGVSDSFIHTEKDGKVLMYVNPDLIIPIKEIILGPKFENTSMVIPFLQEQLDKLSEITHSKPIRISLSNIDYR